MLGSKRWVASDLRDSLANRATAELNVWCSTRALPPGARDHIGGPPSLVLQDMLGSTRVLVVVVPVQALCVLGIQAKP